MVSEMVAVTWHLQPMWFTVATAAPVSIHRRTVQGHRLRLYWHRSGTRANLYGGQGDAPAATVVARTRGRCARGLVGVTAVMASEQFLPMLGYCDGITEAENLAGQQYGLARLCTVVSRH